MSRVSEILLQQGRDAARAAEASGAIWGGAVQQLGQIPGQVVAQQQQQKRQTMEDEARAIALRAAKRGESDVTALDTAFQQPTRDEIINSLPGHLRPTVTKQFADADAAALKVKESRQKINEADNEYLAGLGQSVVDHDYDLSAAGLALMHARNTYADDPELLKRIDGIAAAIQSDPNSLKDIADRLVSLSPKRMELEATRKRDAAAAGKPVAVAPGGVLIDPQTKEKVFEAPAKLPNSQESKFMLNGKSVTGDYVPGANGQPGKYFHEGKDVTGQASPIPPASTIINAQNLADAKGEVSPTAKAIAEYRMAPPSSRSIASGPGKALMDQVLRHNPEYSADMFSRRAPMAKAFTSGPQAQAINSLNTAIGHLDQFIDVAEALDNGSFRPGNQAWNWIKTTFGDSAPTNFEGIRTIMSGELASAFKKSGATDQEIAAVQSALNSANSTKQLIDYATKIAIPALGSKIESYRAQYHQVMGPKDPFQVLSSEAEAVLRKHGIDPDHPSMGNKGDAGPKEGDVKPIDGFPGTEQTFKGGKWIRTK